MSQYEQLQAVRENWCKRSAHPPDRCWITVDLDGQQIGDIASFYLTLGKAVNGVEGYFGACLDSLDDCLCGGFGLRPPFTLRIRNSEVARRAIEQGGEQWRQSYLERSAIAGDVEEDASPDESTSDASGSSASTKSYWDALMQTFNRHGVNVVLDAALD